MGPLLDQSGLNACLSEFLFIIYLFPSEVSECVRMVLGCLGLVPEGSRRPRHNYELKNLFCFKQDFSPQYCFFLSSSLVVVSFYLCEFFLLLCFLFFLSFLPFFPSILLLLLLLLLLLSAVL